MKYQGCSFFSPSWNYFFHAPNLSINHKDILHRDASCPKIPVTIITALKMNDCRPWKGTISKGISFFPAYFRGSVSFRGYACLVTKLEVTLENCQKFGQKIGQKTSRSGKSDQFSGEMEVENGYIWKVTTIGGTLFSFPCLWEVSGTS